jgi:hypothetical protein
MSGVLVGLIALPATSSDLTSTERSIRASLPRCRRCHQATERVRGKYCPKPNPEVESE